MTSAASAVATCAALLLAGVAGAQEAKGTLTANGRSAELKHAIAQEVDSATEKGYMDVIVVLSDRKPGAADARNTERLESMARSDGLVGLVVRLDPAAKTVPK